MIFFIFLKSNFLSFWKFSISYFKWSPAEITHTYFKKRFIQNQNIYEEWEREVAEKFHNCFKGFNEPDNRKLRGHFHYMGLYQEPARVLLKERWKVFSLQCFSKQNRKRIYKNYLITIAFTCQCKEL